MTDPQPTGTENDGDGGATAAPPSPRHGCTIRQLLDQHLTMLGLRLDTDTRSDLLVYVHRWITHGVVVPDGATVATVTATWPVGDLQDWIADAAGDWFAGRPVGDER